MTSAPYRLERCAFRKPAARAGTTTTYPWGKTVEKDRANCLGCTTEPLKKTVDTGSYPPNAFGLFDMVGNAAEWVEDCWNDSYRGAPTDGSAWTRPQCRERVVRGGAFNNDARYLRSAADLENLRKRQKREIDDAKGSKFTFKGPKLTRQTPDGEETYAFKLDGTKKPGEVDFVPDQGDNKGKTLKGIYSLKDGELKLCLSLSPEGKRPKEFASKDGEEQALVVLKQDKS